jgi:hypothetical protein
MTDLTESYALTFHPSVLHTFEHGKKRDASQLKFIRRHGFDEWCRVYGPHIFRNRGVVENMILEIRDYRERNGMSRRYLIEKCTPECLKMFAKQYGADDIVDVLGKSILTKSRRDISESGKEFFFVRKKKEVEMRQILPEHNLNRENIVAMYSKRFFKKLITIISKNVSCIKTKEDIKTLFDKLDEAVSIMLKDSLCKTKVKVRTEGMERYSIDDILRIISSQEGDVPGKIDSGAFLLKIKSGIGAEIKNWIKTLPSTWKSIQAKLKSENKDNKITLDEKENEERKINPKEVRLLKKSIGSYIGPKKPTYEDHFIGMYNGTVKYKRKQVPVKVQRVKRKRSREDLFEGIELKDVYRCNYCDKTDCDAQNPKIGGSIAEFRNPSGICPKELFKSYNFEETLQKIQSKFQQTKKKIEGGPALVILLKKDEPFDKKKHIISMKKVKKIEGEQTDYDKKATMKSVGGHKYEIIGNNLAQSDTKLVEYVNQHVPIALFLMEERD